MRLFNRRGQSAHEFFTTYGWAVFLVLATLFVMAYLGVWNQAAIVPERCAFPKANNIDCLDVAATTDGTLSLRLFNKGGDALFTSGSCAYTTRGEEPVTVTTRAIAVDAAPVSPELGRSWPSGEFARFTCHFDGDNPFLNSGGKTRLVTVDLGFTDANGTPRHATATVRARVEG